MRIATLLYSIAIAAIPISVASKFLLGLTGTTWIDPTLLLALAALLALFSRWGDFFKGDLRLVAAGTAVLFLVTLVCAVSGALLRPPSSLYAALREPIRLWLNLCWFLVSCWFLIYKPRVILRCSIFAVAFGLGAGVYLYLVALGAAPAPGPVISYTRAYLFDKRSGSTDSLYPVWVDYSLRLLPSASLCFRCWSSCRSRVKMGSTPSGRPLASHLRRWECCFL